MARLAKAAVAVYPVRGGLRAAVQPEFAADEVLYYRSDATLVLPAFAILVSAELRAVVVAVRGTASFSDGITDLAATQAHFLGSTAHAGMVACVHSMSDPAFVDSVAAALVSAGHLSSGFVARSASASPKATAPEHLPTATQGADPARASVSEADASSNAGESATLHNTAEMESDAFTALLQRLLAERPGYALAFTGHSLGAGVAAALCLQARAQLFRRLCLQGDAHALRLLTVAAPACGISYAASSGINSAAVQAALHQLPDAAAVALCPLPVYAVGLATPAALSPQLASLGTLTPAQALSFATHLPVGLPPDAGGAESVKPLAKPEMMTMLILSPAAAVSAALNVSCEAAAVAGAASVQAAPASSSGATAVPPAPAVDSAPAGVDAPAIGGAGAAPSPAIPASCEPSAPSPDFCRDWPIISSIVIGDDIVPTLTLPAAREAVGRLQDPAHAAEGRKLVGRDWERASAGVASSFQLGMQVGAPELLRVHARATDALQGVLASAAGSPVVRDATAALDRAAAAAKAAGSSIGSFFRGVLGTPPASPSLSAATAAAAVSVAPPASPSMLSIAVPTPLAAETAETTVRLSDGGSASATPLVPSPSGPTPGTASLMAEPSTPVKAGAAGATEPTAMSVPLTDSSCSMDGEVGAGGCTFERRLARYQSRCCLCVVNQLLQPLVAPGRILHLIIGAAPSMDALDEEDAAGSEPSTLSLNDHGVAADPAVGLATEPGVLLVAAAAAAATSRASSAEISMIASRARAKAAAKAVLAEAEPDSWQGALMPESAEAVAALVCTAVDAERLSVEIVSPDTCARIILSPRAVKDHSHIVYLAAIAAAAELRPRGPIA